MALNRISLTTLVVVCAVCSIHCAYDTSPPSITKDPAPTRGYDILILDKQIPLRLKCDAAGRPPPTYKWMKYDLDGGNPEELDPSDSRITIDDGGDLVIANSEEEQQQEVMAEGENPFLIDKEDEGIYQCIAENVYGAALSRKVKAQLAFIDAFSWVEPINEEASVGAKVVLDCNPPDGVPNPRLSIYWSWGRPGEPIKNPVVHDERVILDGNGNLVFANVQPQDDRNYICIAPNHFIREARNSPIISLAVDSNNPAPQRGPAFVYKPPISQEVLRTKKIEIICAAEGNPTPAITWSWEDKINIAPGRIEYGDGNTKMTVWDVTFDDAGEYTCTATNEKSSTSATTTITVRSAPFWQPSPPEDKTIAPQESIVITCQAGGSPAPAITWLINGKEESEVEPNPRRTIESGKSSGQISIRDAETSDSAVFQCVATNKYGEEITSVFLNVLAIPAEIQTRPNPSYEIAEGSGVELACKPFGAPHPKVTWLFNGQELRGEGGKHSISTGGSNEGMLTIAEVTMADKGVYTCNVSNSFGVDVATPRVIVRMQTAITEGPGDNEVKEGDNAVLPCQIQSDPELELTVEWIMNQGENDERIIDPEVESSRYRLGGDNSLTIIMTKKIDGGKYTCKAITTFSNAEETGTLLILSAPDKPFNVEVASSSDLDVNLQWTEGNDGNSDIREYTVEAKTEFPDLGWKVMKTVSAASTSTTLSLKAYNTYNFRVKATNDVGTSQPSELSDGHTTPAKKPIVNPSDVRGTGPQPGLMIVEWKKIHQSDYAGPDFKYIVKYKVKGTDDWQEIAVTPDEDLRVEVRDDSAAFQEYDVQVITENSEGRSQTEPDTVPGMSGESEPTESPKDVNVKVIDSSSVQVSWAPVPADTIKGILRGYKVYTTITIASGSEQVHECSDSPCVVDKLQAFSDYSLQVTVRNGAGEGPKSDPISFNTPQGPPSTVLNLEARASSDRILVTWDKPERHNGILVGYNLTRSLMLGNTVEKIRRETLDKPDETRFLLDEEIEPENIYRITVAAITGGGEGQEQVVETRTRPRGVPPTPELDFDEIGPRSIIVSYKEPSANSAAADFISVKYYKKGDDVSDAKTTESVDLFDQEKVNVTGLEPNTYYLFQLLAKNSHGDAVGKWEEEKTSGTGHKQKEYSAEYLRYLTIEFVIEEYRTQLGRAPVELYQ